MFAYFHAWESPLNIECTIPFARHWSFMGLWGHGFVDFPFSASWHGLPWRFRHLSNRLSLHKAHLHLVALNVRTLRSMFKCYLFHDRYWQRPGKRRLLRHAVASEGKISFGVRLRTYATPHLVLVCSEAWKKQGMLWSVIILRHCENRQIFGDDKWMRCVEVSSVRLSSSIV